MTTPIDAAGAAPVRLGFRHCDSRMPFLWQSAQQPAARWHGSGEGPANYFADTPIGAWAEFLRHEGITDAAELAGVRRSLWVVELPAAGYAAPQLPRRTLTGGLASYGACQAEARRLRAAGAVRLEAPAAALKAGTARGWTAAPAARPASAARDGRVWVLFGLCSAVGWPAVVAGAPPAEVLPLVRHF
ncbi:MAG: hypothetical protein HS128_06950 [Ideonella sp.]|nr:hypothetical protein [Ideonella sp.]MCC7456390.1 hypothetical protein [Nitrospira sp.]